MAIIMAARSTLTFRSEEKSRSFLRSKIEWLLSPDHFNFKLLFGTAVGVLVILVLAVTCFLFTSRNQEQARMRAHTIGVMRLSSVLENDIAALENAQRGYLLSGENVYLENFERRRGLFQKQSEELVATVTSNFTQRKRVLKMRGIVLKWLEAHKLPTSTVEASVLPPKESQALLGGAQLDEAREILHDIQSSEQIVLNQRVREKEWAVQSTQVLDFIPRLERAVYEMQKEKRGYLLTGDPAFIDSYKRATVNFYTFQGHLSVLVANSPSQLNELERIRTGLERWVMECAVPEMDRKRAGQKPNPDTRIQGEALMSNVRESLGRFSKEQMEIYEMRSAAAAHERILTTTGIDVLCGVVAGLMIASSLYSFIIGRRQFKNLESADTRIRSLIENIMDGMITVDEEGGICSMNPAARRMFGYNENEYAGDSFSRLVPKCYDREMTGDPSPCEWAELAQRTGGIILALAQTRGRATFPVEISLSEMLRDNEKFYVAMVRDITERKHFEEELAAEKNSLAVTLGSIGDGVITTDLSGRILISNPACEALTGWPAAEAAGQKLKTVFKIAVDGPVKERATRGYRSEAEAILRGTPERSTLTARDGTRRVIEQMAAPIYDGKQQLCGVVLVFRDITARLRDETERRKAEALEQLGLLAGGIAHDFNNLLTAIIGNISLVSLLLDPNDEMVERLNDAKNASLRARDLAQQLLTFARGGAPIKKAASIKKIIEDTVSFSLRGSHNCSKLEIEPDLWPAEFDPGQISQVIGNLIVNSDQAMPDGGTVEVSCDNFCAAPGLDPVVSDLRPGDYLRIKVRDQGVGIPEDCLKRIFDPYFTTKAQGNGLGLATTYSIVKNHGGLIAVESEPLQGATFTVYLPAARQELPVEPLPAPPPPQSRKTVVAEMNGSGRILIVDDEEAIRALVEFTLSRLGYVVTEAETALKGVQLYRDALENGQRFDLVILDLTLPGGMGGKDALKKLLEIDPSVTAIVSSGYATDATMSHYEELGFRGVISKPYEAAELGRTVQEIIQASRAESEPIYELQQAC